MAGGDLPLVGGRAIPEDELDEQMSRASGPGGQHVNKTSTRISIRWSVTTTRALTETERARVLAALRSRVTKTGYLVVHADTHRSLTRNRLLARERLAALVVDALRVEKHRTKTKPSRAAKARRRESKRRRGSVKESRSRPRLDD